MGRKDKSLGTGNFVHTMREKHNQAHVIKTTAAVVNKDDLICRKNNYDREISNCLKKVGFLYL